MVTLKLLTEHYPDIPWDEPLKVGWVVSEDEFTDQYTYACRVCVARLGLKYSDPHQWPTEAEATLHIVGMHQGE